MLGVRNVLPKISSDCILKYINDIHVTANDVTKGLIGSCQTLCNGFGLSLFQTLGCDE